MATETLVRPARQKSHMGNLISALCVLMFCLILLSACAAIRKTSFDIPDGSAGIVAYGSLISLASLEQTLGHKYPGPVERIHLTGYERAWSCVRPFNDSRAPSVGGPKMEAFLQRGGERVPIAGTAEMNITPKTKGRINAILYVITQAELADLDKREWGYRRADVTDRIEEFRFRGGKVYAYEGISGRSAEPPPAQSVYVLIKEFRDLITAASDAQGSDFGAEFDKSTKPCEYQVISYKDVIWSTVK